MCVFFLISVWYSSGSQMVSRGLAKGKLWGWRKWKWWTQLIRPKKTHITKPNYACYNHINLVPHDVRRNQVTFLKTCCPMHVEIHTHWKRYLVVSIYITIAIHTCLQHSILVLLSLKIVWIEWATLSFMPRQFFKSASKYVILILLLKWLTFTQYSVIHRCPWRLTEQVGIFAFDPL